MKNKTSKTEASALLDIAAEALMNETINTLISRGLIKKKWDAGIGEYVITVA